jgi:ABC-2 type transport system permease protein
MFLSIRDYGLLYDQYQESLLQIRLNWEDQAEKDPHDAAHDGTYAVKPIYPLAILDSGIQPYTGQVVHLGAHQRKQSKLNLAKDHSGLFRFGALTPNFVLLYIFPILLIFLGYNAFTEEREGQTLRLLLTQGVSATQLVAGKWLALMFLTVLLCLLFSLSVLIGYSLIASTSEQIQPLFTEWLAFIGGYFLYFIVFVNLTLLVSSRAKSSGISLVVLLTVWILFTLIVPKLSTNLAGQLYAFPTLQTFQDNINTDQKNGLNGHNFWNEAAQGFQQQVLKEYGVKTIEELPVDYGGLLLAEGEKYESAVYSKHFDLLQTQYHKQRRVFRFSSLLSPFLPVRFASMALARTDYNFQWHFEEEAEQYRLAFNTALNMNIAEHAKGISNYKAGKDLWTDMPKFQYQWEAPGQIIKDHYVEYATLLLWVMISLGAVFFFSNRIKVV